MIFPNALTGQQSGSQIALETAFAQRETNTNKMAGGETPPTHTPYTSLHFQLPTRSKTTKK